MVGQNEERDTGWYYVDRKVSGKPVLRLRFRCKYNPGYPPHQLISNASLRLIGLRDQLLWFYPLKQTKKGYYDLACYGTISTAVSAVKSRFTKNQKPKAFGLVSVALLELNSVKISEMKREETVNEVPTLSQPVIESVSTPATDILIEQTEDSNTIKTEDDTNGDQPTNTDVEPSPEPAERQADSEPVDVKPDRPEPEPAASAEPAVEVPKEEDRKVQVPSRDSDWLQA